MIVIINDAKFGLMIVDYETGEILAEGKQEIINFIKSYWQTINLML